MTARFVAAQLLCLLLLAALAACSGDAPPADDSAAPATGDNAALDANADGESAPGDGGPKGDDKRSPQREQPDDDGFRAAPPLREDQMSPVESRREQELDRQSGTTDRSESPFAAEEEELFAGEPKKVEPDRAGPESEPAEQPFAPAPGDDAKRPRLVLNEDEQFAAAPPVAVTDAAAPILTDEAAPQPAAPPSEPPYWPRFHGPQGDNKSADTGLLKQWPENGPPKSGRSAESASVTQAFPRRTA